MPIAVTKYTCKFKCKTNSMHLKKKMQEHEDKFCFKNPENKTCATCKNQLYEKDSDEFRTWANRGCKLSIMNDFIEDIHADLQITNSVHIKPLWNCPNHNLSEWRLNETNNYLVKVKQKIEARKLESEKAKKELDFFNL